MKPIVLAAIVGGIILIAVAIYYFVTPANALFSFMPGYDANSTATHLKHGLAAGLLGLASFALAWFQSGSKSEPAE